MKYIIVTTVNSGQMQQEVDDLFKQGYELAGNLCTEGVILYQPMIKYEYKKKESSE